MIAGRQSLLGAQPVAEFNRSFRLESLEERQLLAVLTVDTDLDAALTSMQMVKSTRETLTYLH